MLASHLLLAALAAAAPVPKASPPGPAPYLLSLAATDGAVTVGVFRTEKIKVRATELKAGPNGQPVPTEVEKEFDQKVYKTVPLGELKDLKITTADGKEVKLADAVKKIADGGLVVASADGKAVDAKYLKVFKDDVLVLASPELAPNSPAGVGGPWVNLLPYIEPGNLFVPATPPPIQVYPGSELPPKREK